MSERHANTLDAGRAALVIVDVQEAFRTAIPGFDALVKCIGVMSRGAELLKLPTLVTEQVPAKLGRTVAELGLGVTAIEKDAFSCRGSAAFVDALEATGRKQVLVAGIEAHVCVNQTAHDLIAGGWQVHLLLDCIASRSESNRGIGIQKMLTAGAIPSSVELALFEMMRDARHEQFRAIQKLIK